MIFFLGNQEMLIKWVWHKLKHVCYGKVLKKREFFGHVLTTYGLLDELGPVIITKSKLSVEK